VVLHTLGSAQTRGSFNWKTPKGSKGLEDNGTPPPEERWSEAAERRPAEGGKPSSPFFVEVKHHIEILRGSLGNPGPHSLWKSSPTLKMEVNVSFDKVLFAGKWSLMRLQKPLCNAKCWVDVIAPSSSPVIGLKMGISTVQLHIVV
jgi:hypothetical protein